LAAGCYLLYAQRDDRPGTIYGERDIRPKIEVEFGEQISDYMLILEEGASIAGRVLDPDGNPIEGATVRGPNRTETAADGSFEVTGLFAERGQISVFKEGYLTVTVPQIPAGTENVEVVLYPGGVIRGMIVDADTGGALEEAELGAISTSIGRFEWSSSLLSWNVKKHALHDGAFELQNVQSGDLHLVVRAAGYKLFSKPLQLAPGETVDGVRVALEPSGTLRVEVLDPSGTPVSGADVFIGPVNSTEWTRPEHKAGVTDGSGRVELDARPPDEAALSAFHPQWSTGSALISTAVDDVVQIVLREGIAVTGVVLRDGVPWQEAEAGYLTDNEREMVQSWRTTVDTDGTFRLENVPPGAGEIRVAKRYESASGGAGFVVPIDVKVDSDNHVVIETPAATSVLTGRVTVGGKPVRDGRLQATQQTPEGELFHYAFVNAQDGSYRFEGLLPGPASIEVHAYFAGGANEQQSVTVEIGAEPATRDFAF
jgi:hypothetical protein